MVAHDSPIMRIHRCYFRYIVIIIQENPFIIGTKLVAVHYQNLVTSIGKRHRRVMSICEYLRSLTMHNQTKFFIPILP